MTKLLPIDQVSERSGVAISALRFYEQLGLLASERDARGRRIYAPEVLRRIAFISVGTSVGLTLAEIRHELDRLPGDRVPNKRDWEKVARGWRANLDARIGTLILMRDRLTSCIGCGCLSLRDCSLTNQRDRASARGAGPRFLLGDEPQPKTD